MQVKFDIKSVFIQVVMVVVTVGFFFVYNYLNFQAPRIFNSPDESVNAWTALKAAQGKKLFIGAPRHIETYKYLDPRATFFKDAAIYPGVFLGLPVFYGALARAFNYPPLIFYLTPLFAVLGAWALYFLTLKIFNRRIAVFSFLMYFFVPAVWYYSTRGMFHNILFVSLWLWGLALVFIGAGKSLRKELVYILLASVFLSLSLWVRPSEAVWVFVSLLLSLLALRKSICKYHILIILTLVIIGGATYFIFQKNITGVFAPLGYEPSGASSSALKYILPFGFSIKNIFLNVRHYFFGLSWWLSIPAAVSFIYGLLRLERFTARVRAFYAIYFFTAFFLILVMYGNWRTFDNPADPSAVTLGNSHIRYWLPLFVLSVPLAVLFFDRVCFWFKKKLRLAAALAVAAFFILFSYQTVFQGADGILSVARNLNHGKTLLSQVESLTNESDLIIVEHEDKFLFPKRFVARRFDYEHIKLLDDLAYRTFYLDSRDEKKLERLSEELKQNGLSLRQIGELPPHVLWQIERIQD